LLLLALVGLLSLTYPVEELSRRLGDAFFRLRGNHATSNTVAIVVIDDASLQHFGRWPWPRAQLARLVRAVSRQHPTAVGIDILLPESSDTAGDNELAQAIRDAGNVVLAAKLSNSPDRLWIDPLPLFRAHAAGVGHVQAVMDTDGIGRRVPLVEVSADGPRWPLAVEMARVVTGQPVRLDRGSLWLGKQRIWIEDEVKRGERPRQAKGWISYYPQFLIVNFHQQLGSGQAEPAFLAISAAAILNGQAPAQLQGKAVLIGFGASDLSDRIPTPVSGQTPMPGVEVHANLLDGMLTGPGIRHSNRVPQVFLVLAFSLISTWFVLRRAGWGAVWIPLAMFAACYGSGFWLFRYRGVLLEFGPLLCTAILAVPLAQLENLALVNRALTRGLQQLRGTLSPRLSPGQFPSFQPDSTSQDSTADLQRKLDLIQSLQSELAASYTFRQNLLESMHEGLAVFDAAGKSEFRNPYWERFCEKQGWSPSIELPELGRRLGHPSWSNLNERMHQGDLPPESEIYLGGGFWQVRGLRLPAEGANGPRWMVVITDLTSRLERDQARAEALRFVTHELRTPLVSIQGFSEFLLRYPQAAGSTEAAATIFRESQRLVSLINTYLDVLRFDAGARSLRREPIAIREMVKQVEKIMAPIADSAEIRIRVELDSSFPELLADPPMLTGVLLNLLNNAVKYSPCGSEVLLGVRNDQSAVIFEVCNPGAPIAPEHLSHLFEPFYRAHEHEASTPGWGLGLTFVKRIVDEHRGTIEASSGEDGIRVRVRIPVGKSGAEDGSH
jgi:signal transduction histidine kinase